MMQNNLRKKVRKANENLRKLYDWMDEVDLIEKMTNFTDLKLHDCYYCMDEKLPENMKDWHEDNKDELFDRFCYREYDYLNDRCIDLYKKSFNEMIDRIGHTSSFYMETGLSGLNPSNYNMAKEVLNDLYMYSRYFDINVIDEYSSYITHETVKSLYYNDGYSITDIYRIIDFDTVLEDAKDKYNDYIELYDYIDIFKTNQIEIYKDFLDYEYDDYLSECEEKERLLEEERKQGLKQFIENIGNAEWLWKHCTLNVEPCLQ